MPPGYAPLERGLRQAMLWQVLADSDDADTRWLATRIADGGWPRRRVVGDEAARAARLPVQHAGADPAVQLSALRLMAPLADRDGLRLAGRQR